MISYKEAELFLKDKGLSDNSVIHDISNEYLAPIPIYTWLLEFAELQIKRISEKNDRS